MIERTITKPVSAEKEQINFNGTQIKVKINGKEMLQYQIDFRPYKVMFGDQLALVRVEYTREGMLNPGALRQAHYDGGNELFGLSPAQVIDGVKYTWHHAEGLKKEGDKLYGFMLLVRADVHVTINYTGGFEEAARYFANLLPFKFNKFIPVSKTYKQIKKEIKNQGEQGKEINLPSIISLLQNPDLDINCTENNETLLDLAVNEGLLEVCQAIVETAKVNQAVLDQALANLLYAFYKLPALRHAIFYVIGEFLLKAGAVPEKRVLPNLIFPLLEKEFESGLSLLKLLLQYKDKVEFNVFDGEQGSNLLSKCLQIYPVEHQEPVFKALLNGPINTELTETGEADTPLMLMAALHNNDLSKLLIEYGADITMSNRGGNTALDYAEMVNNSEMQTYFKARLKVTYPNVDFDAIAASEQEQINAAAQLKRSKESLVAPVKTKAKLSKQKLNQLNEELFSAAAIDDLDQVKKLLKAGADVNYVSSTDQTVFFAAVSTKKEASVLEFFLKKGLIQDIHIADEVGDTAILWAQSPKSIRLLLEHGLDINERNYKGETALYKLLVALHYSKDENEALLTALLKEGADVNAKTNVGQTALHVASLWGAKNKVLELLLKAGAKVNEPDIYGKTPLHRAAQKEEIENMKLLLEYGADPRIKCKLGKIPLDHIYGQKARTFLSEAMKQYEEKQSGEPQPKKSKADSGEDSEEEKTAEATSSSLSAAAGHATLYSRPTTRSMGASSSTSATPKQGQ